MLEKIKIDLVFTVALIDENDDIGGKKGTAVKQFFIWYYKFKEQTDEDTYEIIYFYASSIAFKHGQRSEYI